MFHWTEEEKRFIQREAAKYGTTKLGNCGPVAISRAFSINLQHATEMCQDYGYKPGHGMYAHEMESLIKILNPNVSETSYYSGKDRWNERYNKMQQDHIVENHSCYWVKLKKRENPSFKFSDLKVIHGLCCPYCGRYVYQRTPHPYSGPTVAKFAKENPVGTYVLMTNNHFLVVKDGVIVDPNVRGVGARKDSRKLRRTWKVA